MVQATGNASHQLSELWELKKEDYFHFSDSMLRHDMTESNLVTFNWGLYAQRVNDKMIMRRTSAAWRKAGEVYLRH